MAGVAGRRSTVRRAVAAAALVCLAGCGTAGIAPVEGRVTVDGQPAPEGISIEFMPVTPGELGTSIATVGPNGRYEAWNPATGGKGVPLGTCVARLVEGELTTIPPQKPGQSLKLKYDAKAFKELSRFEVKPGKNVVDLELPPVGK